jgi:hypothetical protein
MEEIAVMASRRALLPLALALALAVLVAVGWIAPTPASAQTEVRTQLGWLRNGEFAPVMVAEAKGFFTEEGIRHRIVDGGPGKNPVPIVGAGQATFGITAGGNNVFQARLAKDPVDVIAVGTLLQRGPYSYITLGNPTDPDPKPKDLEGKVVGMQSDGEIFLKAFAKKHGVDLSKVKVEVVQANAEPLLVGRVDFFTGWVTNQPYLIEQEIAKPDAMPRLRGKTWKAMRYADWGIGLLGRHLRDRQDHPREPRPRQALRARGRPRHAVHPRSPGGDGADGGRVPGPGREGGQARLALEDAERAVHQRGHQEERPPLDEPDGLGRDDGLLPGVRPDPARRPRR